MTVFADLPESVRKRLRQERLAKKAVSTDDFSTFDQFDVSNVDRDSLDEFDKGTLDSYLSSKQIAEKAESALKDV